MVELIVATLPLARARVEKAVKGVPAVFAVRLIVPSRCSSAVTICDMFLFALIAATNFSFTVPGAVSATVYVIFSPLTFRLITVLVTVKVPPVSGVRVKVSTCATSFSGKII